MLAGAGLGIACGFVAWTFLVPLAATYYHVGWLIDAEAVNSATARAGISWFRCFAVGGASAALLGALVARGGAARRLLAVASAVSSGFYLTVLRGCWGYQGRPPDSSGAFPEPVPPLPPLPPEAAVIPVIAAAVAGAALLAWAVRANRRKGGTAQERSAGTLLAIHICLSFGGATMTLQLPYYLGAREAFFRELANLLAVLPGIGS